MTEDQTNQTRAFMIMGAKTVQDNMKRMKWIQARFRKGIKYKEEMERRIDDGTYEVVKVPSVRISGKERRAIKKLRASNNWLFAFANNLRMELRPIKIEIYEE